MNRIEKVQALMQERKIAQIIVSDLTSIRYLTECQMILTQFLIALVINQKGKPTLVSFIANLGKVTDSVISAKYFQHQDGVEFLATHIQQGQLIAIDKKMGIGYVERLKQFADFTYIVDDIVDAVRAIKDEEEMQHIRYASKIADQVMHEVKSRLVVGVQEIEISTFIKKRFIELGTEGISFEPTVAFGMNTGTYNRQPRSLEQGDSVILDFGCKYNGYCSDVTRYFMFRSNVEAQKLYRVIRMAQDAAYQVIKPGVKIKEAALASRKVLVDHGYANNSFYHLGHGVGLGIHELFYVSVINEDVFKEGMCFSIEPGVYIQKQIGCRVEDLVLVTKDGCEILNHFDKEDIYLD